jgi:hypothetical protein
MFTASQTPASKHFGYCVVFYVLVEAIVYEE